MATINRNKEIKTDTIALVNRATERYNRNEKAKAYSRSVSQRRKAKELKENVTFIIAPLTILVIGYIMLNIGANLVLLLGGMM